MLKYNYTNFTSSTMAAKILKAMQECIDTGFASYIENRKGQRFMRVNIIKHADRVYAFQFIGGSAQDLGHIILRAMFDWAPEQDQRFTDLTVKVAEMLEHPLITLSRFKAAEEEELNEAKRLGCDTEFTMGSGQKRKGFIQSNWPGRKTLWIMLVSEGRNRMYKCTSGILKDVRHREPLAA